MVTVHWLDSKSPGKRISFKKFINFYVMRVNVFLGTWMVTTIHTWY